MKLPVNKSDQQQLIIKLIHLIINGFKLSQDFDHKRLGLEGGTVVGSDVLLCENWCALIGCLTTLVVATLVPL